MCCTIFVQVQALHTKLNYKPFGAFFMLKPFEGLRPSGFPERECSSR
jgi:hypothetical protein